MSYDAQGTYMQFDSESAIHEKTQKGLLDTKTAYILSELKNANDIRLQAGESYQDGPYAKVVYLDHGLPWAEFIFNYKSRGKSFHVTALTVRLTPGHGSCTACPFANPERCSKPETESC